MLAPILCAVAHGAIEGEVNLYNVCAGHTAKPEIRKRHVLHLADCCTALQSCARRAQISKHRLIAAMAGWPVAGLLHFSPSARARARVCVCVCVCICPSLCFFHYLMSVVHNVCVAIFSAFGLLIPVPTIPVPTRILQCVHGD